MIKEDIPLGHTDAKRIIIQHNNTVNSDPSYLYPNIVPTKYFHDYCGITTYYIVFDSTVPCDIQMICSKDKYVFVVDYKTISDNEIVVNDMNYDFFYIYSKTQVCYTVNIEPVALQSVRLALIICTFNRQDCILKKCKELRINGSDSYHIYIINNGDHIDGLDGSNITVIDSPNYGGSAGFARGILNALKDGYTHVL